MCNRITILIENNIPYKTCLIHTVAVLNIVTSGIESSLTGRTGGTVHASGIRL